MAGGSPEPAVPPPELCDALSATEGAWRQWDAQSSSLRGHYIAWVGGPRRGNVRRRRARRTAEYAALGTLEHCLQPAAGGARENLVGGFVAALFTGALELIAGTFGGGVEEPGIAPAAMLVAAVVLFWIRRLRHRARGPSVEGR
ncbi:YdeI/OmpD-associated family protein [Frankia sp. AiPs1]|uniref:YdeI/OmpD-associated family protein n=1 Tax=Frankia sp. AiPs1 TaxID=573493 RepID=UPI0020436BCF|nr:YdeI/OmpD-associated family protein [Frankia sp. AiPs1]MCM3921638.1 YdeI/OmpD-associated family protein [Frankia sp. AiPs1]